jgi:hypothetical protein
MSIKAKAIEWIIRGIYSNNKIHHSIAMTAVKIKAKQISKEVFPMDSKSKWKSKAVWAAIIAAILGAIQPVSAALGHPIVVPTWVYEVLAAFGLYAIRDAQGLK